MVLNHRMKTVLPLLMLTVTLVTACRASPPLNPAMAADPFDAVRAHIEQLVVEGKVPSMAVAVARDGEIVWEQGFGLADRELGMEHTSVHVGPGLEDGQAVKYTSDGLVVPPCDADSPGASAIQSSAHDLVRFVLFHLKDNLPLKGISDLNRRPSSAMRPSTRCSARIQGPGRRGNGSARAVAMASVGSLASQRMVCAWCSTAAGPWA
jgi:CubicO group peptidase (beta-lactamase class C family)